MSARDQAFNLWRAKLEKDLFVRVDGVEFGKYKHRLIKSTKKMTASKTKINHDFTVQTDSWRIEKDEYLLYTAAQGIGRGLKPEDVIRMTVKDKTVLYLVNNVHYTDDRFTAKLIFLKYE